MVHPMRISEILFFRYIKNVWTILRVVSKHKAEKVRWGDKNLLFLRLAQRRKNLFTRPCKPPKNPRYSPLNWYNFYVKIESSKKWDRKDEYRRNLLWFMKKRRTDLLPPFHQLRGYLIDRDEWLLVTRPAVIKRLVSESFMRRYAIWGRRPEDEGEMKGEMMGTFFNNLIATEG